MGEAERGEERLKEDENQRKKRDRASSESEMSVFTREGDKIMEAMLFVRSVKIDANRLIKDIFGYKNLKEMIKKYFFLVSSCFI
jgi:hypothetical protein